MITRQEMIEKLPYGYTRIVASKAEVSTATVSHYLQGKNNNAKVEFAILELLAEMNQKKKSLLQQIL